MEDNSEGEGEEVGGLFKINKKSAGVGRQLDDLDCSKFVLNATHDWSTDEAKLASRDCFVTGKWNKSEDAAAVLEDDDEEIYGDFEDLETGEHSNENRREIDEASDASEGEDSEASADGEENGMSTSGGEKQSKDDTPQQKSKKLTAEEKAKKNMDKRLEKKKRMKDMFDAEYDARGGKDATFFDDLKNEMEQQAQLNRAEFENMDDDSRVLYEGFRPGMYVRIEVGRVPCEFIVNFDPNYPVVVGGLLAAESNVGYVQMRFKKHRWHKKILKTRDPLVFSLGWRRFQSIPLYSIQDHNGRNRLLKYTPEHMHCQATIWGPITPQNTGFLCIQHVGQATPDFRIAATGVILELDKSQVIVKKLKLTGVPFKIYKKTAFIKDMFNSGLEVAKFEGAKIRTVSGIRGQIKKAVRTPEGAFRATFEDKILLSDIVFARTWYPVDVPRLYNPVTTLLLPPELKSKWQGMKTSGQLRRELNLPVPVKQDSLYREVTRQERVAKPLVIPRELQRSLPFKDKPKLHRSIKDPVQSGRVAVVREPHERKAAQLLKMLRAVHEDKRKRQRVEMRQRAQQHRKKTAADEMAKLRKQKEAKKEIFRLLGKMEKSKEKRMRHSRGRAAAGGTPGSASTNSKG